MQPIFRELNFASAAPEDRFVGFLDILGFADKVTGDFQKTLSLYDDLIALVSVPQQLESRRNVSIRVFSDSILLVSSTLQPVLQTSNALLQAALLCDCLLRGGIAVGKHVERTEHDNMFVVSEPLVYAARLEHSVKYPCVALHSSIHIDVEPKKLLQAPVLLRSILFYDGRWIVNPFNIMWGQSAGDRVRELKKRFPQFSEKYDWFLGLYDAVFSGAKLIPE